MNKKLIFTPLIAATLLISLPLIGAGPKTAKLNFSCFSNNPLQPSDCAPDSIRSKLEAIGCKMSFSGGMGGVKNPNKQKSPDGKVYKYIGRTDVHTTNCYIPSGAGDSCRDQNVKSTHIMTRQGTAGQNHMVFVCDLKNHDLSMCDPNVK